MANYDVAVLGAGYSGLTTAAELANSGERVLVVAKDLGYRPPITICGTQSRRWPGLASSTSSFKHEELLNKECRTMNRFLALAAIPDAGVRCIPALKVSRGEGVIWNKHELGEEALKHAQEVQANAKMQAGPCDPALMNRLKAGGFKFVDETQVICVESDKYFKFLINIVKKNGGCIALGAGVAADEFTKVKPKVVINCLGTAENDGSITSNPGQCVLINQSPSRCPVYIIDDDKNAAIVECPDGSLYLSSAAKPKGYPNGAYDIECTQQTCDDCADICKAIFGKVFNAGDVCESICSDRPTSSSGFTAGCVKEEDGKSIISNNGAAGAGVAASWANAIDCSRAAKKARLS